MRRGRHIDEMAHRFVLQKSREDPFVKFLGVRPRPQLDDHVAFSWLGQRFGLVIGSADLLFATVTVARVQVVLIQFCFRVDLIKR